MSIVGIYRVENQNGQGPYTSMGNYTQREIGLLAHGGGCKLGETHPVPRVEGLKRHHDDYCGFETLQQMQAWFSPEQLHRLNEFGYSVVRYWIDSHWVQFGRYQVVFTKDLGKRLSNQSKGFDLTALVW